MEEDFSKVGNTDMKKNSQNHLVKTKQRRKINNENNLILGQGQVLAKKLSCKSLFQSLSLNTLKVLAFDFRFSGKKEKQCFLNIHI